MACGGIEQQRKKGKTHGQQCGDLGWGVGWWQLEKVKGINGDGGRFDLGW